jgi:hypothetical protein
VLSTELAFQKLRERPVVEAQLPPEPAPVLEEDKRVKVRTKNLTSPLSNSNYFIKIESQAPRCAIQAKNICVMGSEEDKKISSLIGVNGLVQFLRSGKNVSVEDIKLFEWPRLLIVFGCPIHDCL